MNINKHVPASCLGMNKDQAPQKYQEQVNAEFNVVKLFYSCKCASVERAGERECPSPTHATTGHSLEVEGIECCEPF